MKQKEIDDMVRDAKKELTLEEVKDAIRRNSYGGKAITMEMKGGVTFGKTNTGAISKN